MSEPGRRALEDLGLSPYEARVLLALLRSGPATSAQLARSADVPRTSTYGALEALSALGLAHRQPGDGPAVWLAPHPDEVLERLEMSTLDASTRELRWYRARVAEARRLLAETFPPAPAVPLPYVHVLRDARMEARAFEQLLLAAGKEVLILDGPALPAGRAATRDVAAAAAARGVVVRIITAHRDIDAGSCDHREVGSVPVTMVVVDRRAAILGLRGPVALVVENTELAEALAFSFERQWALTTPVLVAETHARA